MYRKPAKAADAICIKCRQRYSEADHQCLEEMSLEELYKSCGAELTLTDAFRLDTATHEGLDRYAGLFPDPPDRVE